MPVRYNTARFFHRITLSSPAYWTSQLLAVVSEGSLYYPLIAAILPAAVKAELDEET